MAADLTDVKKEIWTDDFVRAKSAHGLMYVEAAAS